MKLETQTRQPRPAGPMPDFARPLVLLVHCHNKIGYELDTLQSAAESLLTCAPHKQAELLHWCDLVQTHFAGPGVKHTEDEEVSLFPRLRRHQTEGARYLMAAIDELEAQHREASGYELDLAKLLARLPRDGSVDVSELNRLAEISARLADLYRPHITRENVMIFPAAERILSARELFEVGGEMMARRQMILQRNPV